MRDNKSLHDLTLLAQIGATITNSSAQLEAAHAAMANQGVDAAAQIADQQHTIVQLINGNAQQQELHHAFITNERAKAAAQTAAHEHTIVTLVMTNANLIESKHAAVALAGMTAALERVELQAKLEGEIRHTAVNETTKVSTASASLFATRSTTRSDETIDAVNTSIASPAA